MSDASEAVETDTPRRFAPWRSAVLGWLYNRLAPGGSLVVGNFHLRNPSRAFMEYWADWTLWYRNEGELLRLADTLQGAKSRIEFEESGCQIFLHIIKGPGRTPR